MGKPPIDYGPLVDDLANEVRNGRKVYDALIEISDYYHADPDVLRIRYDKAYPDGAKPSDSHEHNLARAIEAACLSCHMKPHKGMPIILRDGTKVTVICRIGQTRFAAVKHDTLKLVEYPYHALSAAGINASREAFPNHVYPEDW